MNLPDWKKLRALLKRTLHKYKYLLAAATVGLLLLIWPFHTDASVQAPASEPDAVGSMQSTGDTREMEVRLEKLLSQAEGVGRVQVMLTLESGSFRMLACDTDASSDASSSDTVQNNGNQVKTSHVILSDGSGGEVTVTTREDAPIFRGAVILCQGADNAAVRLAVTQAVSALTGLRTDAIAVLRLS